MIHMKRHFGQRYEANGAPTQLLIIEGVVLFLGESVLPQRACVVVMTVGRGIVSPSLLPNERCVPTTTYR